MPPGIGYSRDIPLSGDAAGPQGQGKPGGLSPQEAVQILSLRIPEQPAASAVAPLPLLMSPGMAGAGPGLESMLRSLIAAFPASAPQVPAPNGSGLGRGPNPQVPTFQPSPSQNQRINVPGLQPPNQTPLTMDSPEVQQFLRNNPGDIGRIESAFGRPFTPPTPPPPRFTIADPDPGFSPTPLF